MDLKIVIFVLVLANFSLCLDEIHKFMTAEEVQQVFNTNHENVPEHEVIKVYLSKRFKNDPKERESIWKRGNNSKRDLPIGSVMRTRAFGKNIRLWLVPNERNLIGSRTPVYRAKSVGASNTPHGMIFVPVLDPFQHVTLILENRLQSASFTVRRDLSGSSKINGFIGSENLVIKSLPKSVIEKYGRKRRSLDDSDDSLDSFDHVVYRSRTNDKSINLFPPEIKVKLVERQAGSGIPDVLYPEILVVVEYSTYKAFGPSTYHLLEYLLHFWNGVDLKFRSIENPAIRLHISAIIIATDANSTPYIANHMDNSTHFHRHPAMDDAEKFFYKLDSTFPLHFYDIAVTITNLKLIDAWGFANIRGACVVRHDNKLMIGTVFVHDDTAYRGIAIAAHEIGHSIGAEHDDVTSCLPNYNSQFIMIAGIARSPHASDFSDCSLAAIQKRLQNYELTCLYNKPRQDGNTLSVILPGQIIDRDTYCKKSGYFGASFRNKQGFDHCSYVYCLISPTLTFIPGRAMGSTLDGTECDLSNRTRFCLHQKCVSLDD